MRSAWFDHVRKTRKKLARERKEAVSHREAMSIASTSWEGEKKKYARKIAREKRRQAKESHKSSPRMMKKSQNRPGPCFFAQPDPRTPVILQMVVGILLFFRFLGLHIRNTLSIEMTKRAHRLALRFIESVVLMVSFEPFLAAMFFIIC